MTGADLPPVCILAGGLGTRLGDLVSARPKPLLEVAGEPFLVHQLRLLARYSVTRAVLCVGHLGEQIQAALGPECCGVQLAYSFDGPGLDGTLGAIRRALPLLGDRFLVLYGDTYLRIDYRIFASDWMASGCPAGMAVLHNSGRWDRSNVVCRHGRVIRYDKYSEADGMEWIDYGLGGLTAGALGRVSGSESDLAVLYSSLAESGELFAYEATHRFYEIGTPAALAETEQYLTSAPEV